MFATVTCPSCGKEETEEASHCSNCQAPLTQEDVSLIELLKSKLADRGADLSTIPMVAQEIMAATEDPECTLQSLETIVCRDQVIASKIIQMANSSFYRGLTDVQSLPQAIMRLGFKEVHNVTMAFAISQVYGAERGRYSIEMERLWTRSVSSAIICRELAKVSRYGKAEEAFLAGLVHDIGAVFIVDTLVRMEEGDSRVANLPEEIFQELLQVLHAEAGARLLENWNFHEETREAVLYHHDPTQAEEGQKLAWILSASDLIVEKMGLDGSEPESNLALSNLVPMQALELDDLEIAKLLVDLEEQTQEIVGAMR